MLIEQVKLTQVRTSADNPRTITADKFQKLINSLLVLPKMLEMRPVVVNPRMEALGGNMRLRALKEIAKLTPEQMAQRLAGLKDYNDYSPAERKSVVEWWGNWLEQPFVYIINAKTLSEAERKQFMIKDNVSFGQWDYDALANKWDNAQLNDWGVDVWNPAPLTFAQPTATTPGNTPQPPAESENDGNAPTDFANLPPELQGQDITPDQLPKIVGTDETAMERVIITYYKKDLPWLIALLGLPSIDKVVYTLNEIVPEAEPETTEG